MYACQAVIFVVVIVVAAAAARTAVCVFPMDKWVASLRSNCPAVIAPGRLETANFRHQKVQSEIFLAVLKSFAVCLVSFTCLIARARVCVSFTLAKVKLFSGRLFHSPSFFS